MVSTCLKNSWGSQNIIWTHPTRSWTDSTWQDTRNSNVYYLFAFLRRSCQRTWVFEVGIFVAREMTNSFLGINSNCHAFKDIFTMTRLIVPEFLWFTYVFQGTLDHSTWHFFEQIGRTGAFFQHCSLTWDQEAMEVHAFGLNMILFLRIVKNKISVLCKIRCWIYLRNIDQIICPELPEIVVYIPGSVYITQNLY